MENNKIKDFYWITATRNIYKLISEEDCNNISNSLLLNKKVSTIVTDVKEYCERLSPFDITDMANPCCNYIDCQKEKMIRTVWNILTNLDLIKDLSVYLGIYSFNINRISILDEQYFSLREIRNWNIDSPSIWNSCTKPKIVELKRLFSTVDRLIKEYNEYKIILECVKDRIPIDVPDNFYEEVCLHKGNCTVKVVGGKNLSKGLLLDKQYHVIRIKYSGDDKFDIIINENGETEEINARC